MHQLSDRFNFAPAGSGGAAAFLRFIADEVIPPVKDRYRIDGNRRALHGYSLGGLFAAYVLLQQPRLFQSFLIGAPGLSWDDGAFWKLANAFDSSGKELPARVFLTVGSLDRPNLESVERLQSMFRSRRFGDLGWHIEIFGNETHNSAIPLTLSRGIRWLSGDLSPTS